MQLSTVNIPHHEVRREVAAFRHSVRERLNDEDLAVSECYRQLLKGKHVIDLRETLVTAGQDDAKRPLLAVMRSDCATCFLDASPHGQVLFTGREDWGGRIQASMRFDFPAGTMPIWRWQETTGAVRARAHVPRVPPSLRPKLHLRNFVTLFEATWAPEPPGDPVLLKRLKPYSSPFYVVLAHWDLTDVERAAIGMRPPR